MKSFIALMGYLLVTMYAAAQSANNFDKTWALGDGITYATTFNQGTVSNNLIDSTHDVYLTEGASGICDSMGQLLLCSDGCNIYDKNLSLLDGGSMITPGQFYDFNQGFSSYSQSSIVLPFPNRKYILVTPTASDYEFNHYWTGPTTRGALFDEILYNVIDMNANGGAGKVTQKAVPLLEHANLSKVQMTACKHGDGKSWWLLKQASDTNMVYKYLFTKDTILGPYIQGFPEPHFTKFDIRGQSVISRDGARYATGCQGDGSDTGTGWVFVSTFDRCSGFLGSPRVYKLPPVSIHNPYDSTETELWVNGLAFSPSGRYLYVSQRYNIQQIDLLAANPQSTWTVVGGLDTTWDYFQTYSSIYLGPDDRIYIGNWNGFSDAMSVISSPNNGGTAANFCPRCNRYPAYVHNGHSYNNAISTPPNMPNYHLGATSPACALGVDEVAAQHTEVKVYPNPTTGRLNITYTLLPAGTAAAIYIIDLYGRTLLSVPMDVSAGSGSIDFSSYAAGIYYYRFIVDGQQKSSGKIVLAR